LDGWGVVPAAAAQLPLPFSAAPAFDGMKTRVLDRIETNFDHIDFGKMSQALELAK
jgi:hypothetical protein